MRAPLIWAGMSSGPLLVCLNHEAHSGIKRLKKVTRSTCTSGSAFSWMVRLAEVCRQKKTNTYAKDKNGLQRILNTYWVVYNFVRIHFTTNEVPAVALGVIDRRLSTSEIMLIQIV